MKIYCFEFMKQVVVLWKKASTLWGDSEMVWSRAHPSLRVRWVVIDYSRNFGQENQQLLELAFLAATQVDLGGLGVTCSPRDPRLAGSNPTEVDGFFQDVKILSTSPPGGNLSWGSRV